MDKLLSLQAFARLCGVSEGHLRNQLATMPGVYRIGQCWRIDPDIALAHFAVNGDNSKDKPVHRKKLYQELLGQG